MYYNVRYAIGKLKLKLKERKLKREYLNNFCRTQNFDHLQRLKGQFAGQRCFIVGNAPSLNKHDLSLLVDEHCFLFNGAYELIEKYQFQKAYLAIEDRLVIEDHIEHVNILECKTFIPSDLMYLVANEKIIEVFFSRSCSELSKTWPPFVDPHSDKPVFYWGGTVAYFGIQLAAWMGFSECYVIGVDLTYSIPKHVTKKGSVLLSNGDDPNHYNVNYFGKGKRWHVPKPERMLRAFQSITQKTVKTDMRIFNAGIGGNLDCFPRVIFEECFHDRP